MIKPVCYFLTPVIISVLTQLSQQEFLRDGVADRNAVKRAFAMLFVSHSSVHIQEKKPKLWWWHSSSSSLCVNRKSGHRSAFDLNTTFWYSSCTDNTLFWWTLRHPVTSCWLLWCSESEPGKESIKSALHSTLNVTILSKQSKKKALLRGSPAWYLVCLSAAAVKYVTGSRCSTNFICPVH